VPALFPRRFRLLALVAVCLSFTACSLLAPPPQLRGEKVQADQLKQLVPGTSTKADVMALIGSPSQTASFDDNTWLYISELTQPRIGRTLGVLSQHVVVLSFNDKGVLEGVKTLNQDDALPVSFASRTTPSPGTEASFMQQLLGNIGRFNAAGGPSGFGTGGGAPSAGTSGP
jgi:outer membrane protein assembly factor BamE (lipoprotein component of BamABCDE complex)